MSREGRQDLSSVVGMMSRGQVESVAESMVTLISSGVAGVN